MSVSRPESERLADDKLQKWGNLGKAATFLDGGVLNNKPFSHTLKAIFSRSADREVKRKLFYVEPDPECMKQLEDPTVPNFVQTILAALIGIPGYQSIAGDLKFLREHNSKLEQYNRLVKDLDEASAPGPRTKTLYEHCRRVFICDRVLQGVFRVQGRDALIDPRDRDRAAKLANKFDQYDTDWNALFSAFDVYYRLRRLTRVTYLIHDLLYNDNKDLPLSDRAATQYRRLWQVLNQQTALYEVLRSAMEELIDNAPIPWKTLEIDQVWSSVRNAYSNLLDDDGAPAKCIEPPKLDEIEGGSEWLPSISLTALNQALLGCCKDIAQGVQHGTLPPLVEARSERSSSASMNTRKASSSILPIRAIGYAQPTQSSWTLTPIFSHSRWLATFTKRTSSRQFASARGTHRRASASLSRPIKSPVQWSTTSALSSNVPGDRTTFSGADSTACAN